MSDDVKAVIVQVEASLGVLFDEVWRTFFLPRVIEAAMAHSKRQVFSTHHAVCDIVADAMREERKACADIALKLQGSNSRRVAAACVGIANAIRARGNPDGR